MLSSTIQMLQEFCDLGTQTIFHQGTMWLSINIWRSKHAGIKLSVPQKRTIHNIILLNVSAPYPKSLVSICNSWRKPKCRAFGSTCAHLPKLYAKHIHKPSAMSRDQLAPITSFAQHSGIDIDRGELSILGVPVRSQQSRDRSCNSLDKFRTDVETEVRIPALKGSCSFLRQLRLNPGSQHRIILPGL